MDFDVPRIVVGLAFSGVGFVYFSYGKKMGNVRLISTGVGLMVYPYFVNSLYASIGAGVALAVLPFILRWW